MDFINDEIKECEFDIVGYYIEVNKVEIDTEDVFKTLFSGSFEEFNEELTEVIINNWQDFDGEQQYRIFDSLAYHLTTFADGNFVKKYLESIGYAK